MRTRLELGLRVTLASIADHNPDRVGSCEWIIDYIEGLDLPLIEGDFEPGTEYVAGTIFSMDGQFRDRQGVLHVPILTKKYGLVEAIRG